MEPEPRITCCRGLVCLAALVLALITAPPVLARPTLDDGKPRARARAGTPACCWSSSAPASRPATGAGCYAASDCDRWIAGPLVPDLFEVRVPPGKRVRTAERTLRRRPEVLYTQPDWHQVQSPDAGPSDPCLVARDHPLFWPSTFTPPQGCQGPQPARTVAAVAARAEPHRQRRLSSRRVQSAAV